ncbi:MAG: murein biosynthesis integral membrane protein MurJ [Myxococcota bacterium]
MSSSEERRRYRGPDPLSTESNARMARSAGVVGGATLASRVLGLARDVVLAATFTQAATDSFFVAFMIPNLLRRLVGEGALTLAFVPVFTGWLRRSREEARRVFNATWTLSALIGAVLTLGGIVLAAPLVHLFAPGFTLEPGKFELCVSLLRLCFPYILLLMLVAVAMGALNSVGHFLAPAVAPVLLNLCLIGAALLAAPLFEPPILALGVAVVAAGILQVALQVPPLSRRQLSPRPVLAPGHPAIRRLGRIMAPALLGASVFQLNILVSRFLASFEGNGAVSNLYYADRLIEFPLGVFVFAIGTASLPAFARRVKARDRRGLSETFSGSLSLALSLAIPSTLGLILLAPLLVAALFAWNGDVFGAQAVEGCARALFFYSLGVVPITVSRTYVNLCMAHENTRTPAQAAIVSLIVNTLAALALIGPLPVGPLPEALVSLQHGWVRADLGYPGLALASSIAALANALYLIAASGRRYGRLLHGADLVGWGRLVLAAAFMVVGLRLGMAWLSPPPSASLANLARLAVLVTLGAGLYAGGLRALRSPELGALASILRRHRPASSDDGL